MLVSQIYHLGNAFFDQTSEMEVMLGFQNPVHPIRNDPEAKILFLSADLTDPSNINYYYEINEYDSSQEYLEKMGIN